MRAQRNRTQAGFTVIELVMTAAIMVTAFSLLSFGMFRSYRVVDSYAEIQSQARLALDTMAKDIRGAEEVSFVQPTKPVSGTVVLVVEAPVSDTESEGIIYHYVDAGGAYDLKRTRRTGGKNGTDLSERLVAHYLAAATASSHGGASYDTVLLQLFLAKDTVGTEQAEERLQTEVMARNKVIGG